MLIFFSMSWANIIYIMVLFVYYGALKKYIKKKLNQEYEDELQEDLIDTRENRLKTISRQTTLRTQSVNIPSSSSNHLSSQKERESSSMKHMKRPLEGLRNTEKVDAYTRVNTFEMIDFQN